MVGAIDDVTLYVPTQVLFDKPVKQFALGENSLAILSENNEVYFSGLELSYRPLRFDLPEGTKVKQVSCNRNSIFVLTEDNRIYSNSEE